MRIVNIIAWIILLVGGINWLLIGLFEFNIVASIFGTAAILSRIIYTLVGLSAIWLIASPIAYKGEIALWN